MTALVGPSGAGKSTILNLIPRFYNAQNGEVKIDKQSIYNSTIYSVRKNISLVSQDTTLFDDTIYNNIAYANLNVTVMAEVFLRSIDGVIKASLLFPKRLL